MAVTLDDLRARVDPAVLGGQPTLGSLKARLDRDRGRVAPIPRRRPPRASEALISAMIQTESDGDPNAVSPKGAQGLMQIMPATAKDLGLVDPLDPEQNRAAGTRYINRMLNRYEGDPELALMAYNWGPGRVDKWLAKGRPPKAVPRETRDYVAKLLPVAQRAEPQGEPTLEGLRARVDRALGRESQEPTAQQGRAVPTLEGLKARIRAAKEIQGEQEPYEPEPPQQPFAHWPRAPRPTSRRPDASAPAGVDEPQSLTRSAFHGVAQGAAGGLAGFPEVVGIQRQKRARGLLEQFDRIDRGEMPDPEYRASPGPVPAMDYLTADAETRRRMRDEVTAAIQPIAEEPAYQLGQRIRQSTSEAFPIPEEHEGRFPVQLGRGIGSTATFLATGVAGRLLKLPVLAVTAGTGATVNAAQTFRDAVDFGASFEDAYEASKMAAVVGTSEALPIVRLLDRFDKATGGQIKRVIVNAAKGGIEEGAQELFQSIAENLIASDLVAYDPEREMFTGSGDAAGVGFTVGALFNTLAGMLGVRVRAARPQDAAPESAGEQAAPDGGPEPGAQDAPVAPPESPGEAIPPVTAPVAPDEPVVVRPGEDSGGVPIPPVPGTQVPASLSLAEFSEYAKARQREHIAEQRTQAKITAAGGLTDYQAQLPPNHRMTPDEAKTRLVELDVMEAEIDARYSEEELRQAYEMQKQAGTLPAAATPPATPPAQGPAGFTSETQVRADLPPATGEPKPSRIPIEGGIGIPETIEVKGPDGSIRVEVVRKPPPKDAPGALGEIKFKSVRRSTESYLDEADRRRHVSTLTKDQKVLAEEARQSNLAAFDAAYQELERRVYGGETEHGVEVEVITARDKRTTFKFSPTLDALENLLATKKRYEKLPAQTTGYGLRLPEGETPTNTAGLIVPEAGQQGVERAIETEGGPARIVFPDELHERLFDLAEGRPSRAEVRALHGELEGYVLENFRGPADVIALARDYRAEVLDQARTAAQHRGGRSEAAPLVIDPDEQTRYLQRPTLASLRARVDRAMGRQPAAEGELPETARAETPGDVPTVESLRRRVHAGIQASTEPGTAQAAVQGSTGPGAAYVGFVQDQVEGVAPAVDSKPIRREDILRPLMKDLGAPLYQGRIKSKKFLGFYRRHIEEIRIKRMNDIQVAAHEIAHLLDDRIPEIRRQWNPASNANKEIRDELRGVSYDKSKLFEGFAEFVRLWSTQREEAKARAPKFYGWFEDFLARNEHGPALRKAQEGMHAWIAQDAVSQARSKIGVTEEINAGLTRPFDKFRQGVADDLHGIYQMERQLTGTINPVGPYETARLTRGKHAIIEGALLYGAPVVKPDGSHAFEGKGLSQILDPVAERLDDFLMYAVGRSAHELMQQGREHLFTRAEIAGMQALETREFRKAFNEYQDWNKAILDFAEAKGVINPFFRATWKRTQYLPFHRVGQPGAFSPVPGDWKGIRALTGGTDNLRDILGNMIGNASTLIDAALTNEARLEVANLARQRGGARFMARIPTDERITKVHRDEIERAILEALGVEKKAQLPVEQQKFIDQIVQNMGPMVPLLQRGQSPYGNNVVAVLRDGKPEFYEVADPLLYSSLTHLNRPSKHWLIRLLSLPKRIGQASITLTADFLLANVARDTLSGWVMSRHGFKPMVDSARGMKSRIASDPAYRDFIANGGGFSSYFVEETAFKTHLERFYGRRGIDYQAVLDTPAKLLYGLERFADAFEMITRLGEYRKAIKAGEQPRHAAYSAREVSTDFAMRGDSAALGFLYDTIIFLKAAVNGMDRLYRGLAHDPNRATIAAKTGLIALASMGLYALNRGNPLYDDLEDWDKDTAWHFFIPRPETIQAWADGRELPPLNERYLHFRYPKIWEIGAVGSLAERSLERSLDDQPEKIAGDAWRIIRDVFRFEYLPAAVAPLFELATNRNRFLDRPIETPTMKELQPWARSGSGTSRTLRALGEAERNLPRKFQASPAQVEALLRGYFHTWASYGLSLSDAAFFDDVPSLRVDQYPVIRRFYQGTPPRHSKYVTQLYDALEAATEARRTMRHMDRTFRPDFAKEIERTPENLEFGQLSNAQKVMRTISAEMRQVVDIPDLPSLRQYARYLARDQRFRSQIGDMRSSKAWRNLGDLKRDLLDLWTEERSAYAKAVMTDIEKQRRQREGAK